MKRKWALILILGFGVTRAFGQDASSAPSVTPSASPVAAPIDPKAPVPWDQWFKKNTIISDKTDHVNIFWNAQDFKTRFEGKDKDQKLAEAALQLADRLYPAGAKADLVTVDIAYFLERDDYGELKWDSMQRVAHFEVSRATVAKWAKKKTIPSDTALGKIFSKIQIY
jgi:hypothetical protein